MSDFRCLALETGVRPPSIAACNGDRHFETHLPEGTRIAVALYETIDKVMGEVDLSLEDLDCIAFGRGPGAFTGLRVAAAAAQGLATGLGIRLCAVSSLAALAQNARDRAPKGAWIAPALPAGREQVYLGWYRIAESGLVSAETEDQLAPASRSRLPGTVCFVAAGKVWADDKALQAANASRITEVVDSAAPGARAVLRLAKQEYFEGRLLSPEDARPVYLRGALGDLAYKA